MTYEARKPDPSMTRRSASLGTIRRLWVPTDVIRGLSGLIFCAALFMGATVVWYGDVSSGFESAANATVDAARVEGHAKCVDCHSAEVRAWKASKHATRAFDLLRTSSNALDYAKKLDIEPRDIARNSICVRCHATPLVDEVTHRPTVLAGVSCEACHNPSGGPDGWLNAHASYGTAGTRREHEDQAHYQQRAERCRDAGQLRSGDLYGLAKRCFACHVVGDQVLAETGHPLGDRFELTTAMLGEVRHNLFLNDRINAEVATLWTDPLHHGDNRTAAGRKRVIYLVGQLVDLEASFRNLAQITDDGAVAESMVARIEATFFPLVDLTDDLEEAELPEIESLVESLESIVEEVLDGFDPESKQLYLEAAQAAAQAAQAVSRRDGKQLAEIDELGLLPEEFTGVYQP